jgi:hypothetical protein
MRGSLGASGRIASNEDHPIAFYLVKRAILQLRQEEQEITETNIGRKR